MFYNIIMNLKDYLKLNGISREKFANEMGVSYASVIKWVYGGRFPRPSALNKIYELTEGKVQANDFLQQIQK